MLPAEFVFDFLKSSKCSGGFMKKNVIDKFQLNNQIQRGYRENRFKQDFDQQDFDQQESYDQQENFDKQENYDNHENLNKQERQNNQENSSSLFSGDRPNDNCSLLIEGEYEHIDVPVQVPVEKRRAGERRVRPTANRSTISRPTTIFETRAGDRRMRDTLVDIEV
jgi:hypothetical protein